MGRLVVVRHGMGHHNDMGGALSIFNRDATLNEVGQQQAAAAQVQLLTAV
jgi:broad specificity phosphatase PhoE